MSSTLLTDDQLWELVEPLWATMLGLEATRIGGEARGGDVRGLSVSVQIGGAFHGTVLFLPTEGFARRAAARMLAVSESSLAAADVDDAVGELCNILGGGIKNLVPVPSSMSLPNVGRGLSDASAGRVSSAVGLCFTCEEEPLELRVLEYPGDAHSSANIP